MENCKLANPNPLGFTAFGLAVILLNLHNAGFLPLTTTTVAMALFCGGLAQLLAGILEFRRGNTFAVTAFLAYGFYWTTLAVSWYLPSTDSIAPTDHISSGIFLGLWGVFTLFLFIATLKLNTTLKVIFLSMTLLFFFLAIGSIAQSPLMTTLGGISGIICGIASLYLAMADVINEVYAKTVFPIDIKKIVIQTKTFNQ